MEYLMTYGWAILIIAVVLGAIYSLGLFNSASLAPRAQPGSCEVLRPNGALTTTYISLAGACTNELPQYVAQFNGASSYINTGASGLPTGSSARSMFAWINVPVEPATGFQPMIYGYGTSSTDQASILMLNGPSGATYFSGWANDFQSSFIPYATTWHFVGWTYAAGSTNAIVYTDGQSQTSSAISVLNTVLSQSNIGKAPTSANPVYYFQGEIANIQVYNTTLDANSVKALYQEGIGGAPINLQGLVAWWPLNGNANDYSGDVNNGVPTNVVFTNQWLVGYTVP